MVSVGISDHSFTEFDRRYCIKQEALEDYHKEICRVREAYAGVIEVYAGLEYDGYTELKDRERYDYLIGDCHYVKTFDGYHSVDHAKDEQWAAIEAYFDSDPLAYSKAYLDTYVERTRLHKPDVLGHFDLSAKFGFVDESDPAYRKAATEAMLACLEVTPVVEMNTGAISRKVRSVPYPADFLLPEILAHGGKIVITSDAHRIENLAYYFDESVELLKAAGFRSIVMLHHGQFEEFGI
jgi:histidinol-phosphatase (PHP family)